MIFVLIDGKFNACKIIINYLLWSGILINLVGNDGVEVGQAITKNGYCRNL